MQHCPHPSRSSAIRDGLSHACPSQLDKAHFDAAEMKAGFDKVTADAAEFKAGFDKAVYDNAEMKAGYDKATYDAAEIKAGYDKLTADAAEFKAGFDKAVYDNAEQQAQVGPAPSVGLLVALACVYLQEFVLQTWLTPALPLALRQHATLPPPIPFICNPRWALPCLPLAAGQGSL